MFGSVQEAISLAPRQVYWAYTMATPVMILLPRVAQSCHQTPLKRSSTMCLESPVSIYCSVVPLIHMYILHIYLSVWCKSVLQYLNNPNYLIKIASKAQVTIKYMTVPNLLHLDWLWIPNVSSCIQHCLVNAAFITQYCVECRLQFVAQIFCSWSENDEDLWPGVTTRIYMYQHKSLSQLANE